MPVVPFTRLGQSQPLPQVDQTYLMMAAAELHEAGRLVEPAFDPEGAGYDMETARAAGLKADDSGHWPSRDPQSGQILKGRQHPTYNLTEEGEAKAGYKIRKGDNGRYYSSKDSG